MNDGLRQVLMHLQTLAGIAANGIMFVVGLIARCRHRVVFMMIAGGLFGILTAVAMAPPNRDGYGTHTQLGLSGCAFRALYGRPCPACGMTTAWANLIRGDVVRAFQANVGGALLAIVAIAAVPWLCIATWYGRWVGWKPNAVQFAWISVLFVSVTLTDWLLRLWAR